MWCDGMWCGVTWCDVMWCDAMYDMIWHYITSYDMTRYDTIQCDITRREDDKGWLLWVISKTKDYCLLSRTSLPKKYTQKGRVMYLFRRRETESCDTLVKLQLWNLHCISEVTFLLQGPSTFVNRYYLLWLPIHAEENHGKSSLPGVVYTCETCTRFCLICPL